MAPKNRTLNIKIANLNKKRKIDSRYIKKIAKLVLKKTKVDLNIVFVTDSYIKRLNRIYKHNNSLTDVLCFSMPEGIDIFISSDRAAVNSRRFGTTFKKEIYLYVIHGILHILGYRDEGLGARRKMKKLEKRILAKVI